MKRKTKQFLGTLIEEISPSRLTTYSEIVVGSLFLRIAVAICTLYNGLSMHR